MSEPPLSGLVADARPTSELPEPSFATILGTSQDRSRSFESLKRALSSGNERESLYVLPIEDAITVIDTLEQVSAKYLAL